MQTFPHAATTPIIVMGVSGCGKTVIGSKLAARLGAQFIDGDQLHPNANVTKMQAGTPLTDSDRWPWLQKIAHAMTSLAVQPKRIIVACSALRKTYRNFLIEQVGQPIRFVHLHGSKQIIAQRLASRENHFMPASMIESQFATLEPPNELENVITIDIDQSVDAILAQTMSALELNQNADQS